MAWISSCYNKNLCCKQSFCIFIRHYSSACTKMLNNSNFNAWTMLTLHTVYFQSRKCWFNKEVARRNLFYNLSHAVSPQMTCYSSNIAHVWVRSLSSQMSIKKIHRKTLDKMRINDALLEKESKQLLTWILSCYKESLCCKHRIFCTF